MDKEEKAPKKAAENAAAEENIHPRWIWGKMEHEIMMRNAKTFDPATWKPRST